MKYDFLGYHFALADGALGLQMCYEPSPYIDYNGAGLLYFAAYPTIADTIERRLIVKHRLADTGCDWASQSSTIARDVYYYRNLDLGKNLIATLKRFDRVGENVVLHTSLTKEMMVRRWPTSLRLNGCQPDPMRCSEKEFGSIPISRPPFGREMWEVRASYP